DVTARTAHVQLAIDLLLRHVATPSSPTSHVVVYHLFFLLIPPPPTSTLFPYTTLFRSVEEGIVPGGGVALVRCLTALDKLKAEGDRKSTRLNSSHQIISYAVFCLKKKKKKKSSESINYSMLYTVENIMQVVSEYAIMLY